MATYLEAVEALFGEVYDLDHLSNLDMTEIRFILEDSCPPAVREYLEVNDEWEKGTSMRDQLDFLSRKRLALPSLTSLRKSLELDKDEDSSNGIPTRRKA